MLNLNFTARPTQKPDKDTLHVNYTSHHIKGHLTAFRFIDNDTNQWVVYLPTLELSGYGETLEKAQEMLRFHIEDFSSNLVNISRKESSILLQSLGWSQDAIFKKDFSKVFVDEQGQLQSFNAKENSLQRVTLEAA